MNEFKLWLRQGEDITVAATSQIGAFCFLLLGWNKFAFIEISQAGNDNTGVKITEALEIITGAKVGNFCMLQLSRDS